MITITAPTSTTFTPGQPVTFVGGYGPPVSAAFLHVPQGMPPAPPIPVSIPAGGGADWTLSTKVPTGPGKYVFVVSNANMRTASLPCTVGP
jgi:hypothetical protein